MNKALQGKLPDISDDCQSCKGKEGRGSSFTTFINMCRYFLEKMGSKNITLKVKSELYNKYRALCKNEGWIVSRQFEKLMEEQLKENENNEQTK